MSEHTESQQPKRMTRRLRDTVNRLRPGPSYESTGIWAPMPAGSEPRADTQVEAEVNDIARIVEQRGVASAQRLRNDLNTRSWGPGRFHTAIQKALDEGRIKRIRRGLYAKPSMDV